GLAQRFELRTKWSWHAGLHEPYILLLARTSVPRILPGLSTHAADAHWPGCASNIEGLYIRKPQRPFRPRWSSRDLRGHQWATGHAWCHDVPREFFQKNPGVPSTRTSRRCSARPAVAPDRFQRPPHIDDVEARGLEALQRSQLGGVRLFFIRAQAHVHSFMHKNASQANQAAPVERILERVAIQLGPRCDVDHGLCAAVPIEHGPGLGQNADVWWTQIHDDDFRRLGGKPVQEIECRLDWPRPWNLPGGRRGHDRVDE